MSKYNICVILFLLTICFVPAIILNMDINNSKLEILEEKVKVEAYNIPIKDIQSIELLENVTIGERLSGTSTITYYNGIFNVDGNESKVICT